MAVSNSFDFTLNRDALIKRAMRICDLVSANQTPTASEISDGSEMLNLMLKAWQADGLNLWQVRSVSVTPVASRQIYTMGDGTKHINTGARPLDIVDVYRRDTSSQVDVPLTRISREEFWKLGDKDQTGTPVNYFYDPQLSEGKLYIWPRADSTFATNNSLQILYSKPVDDMDTATDTLSFPSEWELAVVLGLAALLAVEYHLPVEEIDRIERKAMIEKDRVLEWDTEHGSVFFYPDKR